MKITRLFLLALFSAFSALFLAVPAFADPLFILPQKALYGGLGGAEDSLPAKADLRRGTLPNGLRYYILENSLPAGRAYLTLAVDAGSILEEEDERGLAHFVEHMAFNGTERFPGAEVVNYLRSLGMRFGPEVNAYTGYEETVYGIEAPVEISPDGIKRIPQRALAILDDWTRTVAFDPAAVDKERSIIMEEYRTRLGAQERLRRQMLPLIFRDSRFAERLPIGLPEVIQNAPAEKLSGFYHRWYRPDNMALILVGDFDGAVLERELSSHFAAGNPAGDAVPAGDAGTGTTETPFFRPRYELPEPRSGELHSAVFTDPELPSSTVYLFYKQKPKAQGRTLEDYREGLVSYLVESMIDFRFGEAAARGNTPYMYASVWTDRHGRSSRYFIIAAQSKTGGSSGTLKALLEEKERLCRYGFTREELDQAKATLLSSLEMMEAEKDRRESEDYLQELTADFLYNRYALDLEWELEAAAGMLPAIALKTVNTAVAAAFADDDLTVLAAAPEAEAALLPGEAAIAAMAAEIRTADIAPPQTSAAVSLLAEEPRRGTTVSITQDESGAEIWQLSNGMTLILTETSNKNNELSLYALARGGIAGIRELAELQQAELQRTETRRAGEGVPETPSLLETTLPEDWRFSAELAAEIKSASGLGDLSRTELMIFLADKQASLAFWTDSSIRGFRGSSTVKDLPVLFRLLHASFTDPKIDQTGLSLVLEEYRTNLIQEADSPEVVFSKELNRLVYGNHPLFRPLETEDLDKVNEEAVNRFLSLALNPADYTLVLAGSLGDRGTLRELVEIWLASIPAGEFRWNRWTDPKIERPGKTEKIIRKGREEKTIVYQGWFTPRPWSERENAAVLVLNEYLDIVLTDEIREALGGVYSVSARASLAPMPVGELSLGVYFICDPGREEELRRAVRDRISALAEEINEETLARSKAALVKSFERSMENNGFRARNLANFTVITGTPLANLEERPHLYQSITAAEIKALAAAFPATADLSAEAAGPAELILLPESANK